MNTIALGAGALTRAEMHHCHSFSRFSRPYRPVIIDMHSPRGSCAAACVVGVSHSRLPVWDNPLHGRSGRVMEPADR